MKFRKRGGFLGMLLGTLGASLLGNMLASKEINRAGEGFIRATYKPKRSSAQIFDLRIFHIASSYN